jgi:hypothetical protein
MPVHHFSVQINRNKCGGLNDTNQEKEKERRTKKEAF